LADKVLIIHTDNSLFLIFEVFNANIGSLWLNTYEYVFIIFFISDTVSTAKDVIYS
jgi:hypothetical protein